MVAPQTHERRGTTAACRALLPIAVLFTALAGCSAHMWTNDRGNTMITSDPPEAYPELDRHGLAR